MADGRYDYLETGSLISIKENVKDIVIPSEERHINMYPLDFEEFAIALGEELLVEYIKKCFEKKEPLERGMHNKAMLLFHQYMLVGGMPKPVVAFVENKKDFTESDKEKRDILRLYREDIMKIDARYRRKVLSIYDQIPGFLSQHEKRIVFKQLQDGSYAEQYEETFFWLADSMISNESFLCNDPIEVKSGKQYKTTSLNNFRENYRNRIGESYIIHPRNLIIKDGIVCVPPYMTMMYKN